MGRPSKLTEKQWAGIEKRLLAGEAGCALAKEHGVSYNAIKKRLSAQVNQTKDAAKQIIAAESALAELSISSQINAVNLAAKMRAVGEHLAGAAHYGAMTAHRLTYLANNEACKLDDAAPIDSASIETVKNIAALTRTANEAGMIGMALIKTSKDESEKPNDSLNTITDAELEAIASGRA